MMKEAIVLAGGLGTRLNEIVSDVPKPMATINGRPFLEFLLEFLLKEGIQHVVLSVGYKHEIIINHFKNNYKGLHLNYSIEPYPLGTGGGIKASLSLTEQEDIFVLNGDTFFNISLNRLYEFHQLKGAKVSVALKSMKNFKRYGLIEIGDDHQILAFREKHPTKLGLINGGI